jgi:hypothetical protein
MGNGQWAIGNGQQAMGNGQWAIGNGQQAIGNGQWQWATDNRLAVAVRDPYNEKNPGTSTGI